MSFTQKRNQLRTGTGIHMMQQAAFTQLNAEVHIN